MGFQPIKNLFFVKHFSVLFFVENSDNLKSGYYAFSLKSFPQMNRKFRFVPVNTFSTYFIQSIKAEQIKEKTVDIIQKKWTLSTV